MGGQHAGGWEMGRCFVCTRQGAVSGGRGQRALPLVWFRHSDEMRARLSGGHLEAPILLSVGRLGNEKNLKFLRVGCCGLF